MPSASVSIRHLLAYVDNVQAPASYNSRHPSSGPQITYPPRTKTPKPLNPAQAGPFERLQLRVQRFLGRIGGHSHLLVPDVNLAKGGQDSLAWDVINRVKFALPFRDEKPDIYLGGWSAKPGGVLKKRGEWHAASGVRTSFVRLGLSFSLSASCLLPDLLRHTNGRMLPHFIVFVFGMRHVRAHCPSPSVPFYTCASHHRQKVVSAHSVNDRLHPRFLPTCTVPRPAQIRSSRASSSSRSPPRTGAPKWRRRSCCTPSRCT